MESETFQISRLLRFPALTDHYQDFYLEIRKGLTSRSTRLYLGAIVHLHTENPEWAEYPNSQKLESAYGSILESLSTNENEETISQIIKTTSRLRSLLKSEESFKESEERFRNWLQRNIVVQASIEEPQILNDGSLKDPFSKATELTQKLVAMDPLHLQKEGRIQFPLASLDFEEVAKIPIGLDVFDESELDGGAEYNKLLTISGESNIGKSHLGMFFESHIVAQRHTGFHGSAEDSYETTKKRLLAHFLRKSAKDIKNLSIQERKTRMIELYGDPEDKNSLHHHLQTKFGMEYFPEGLLTPKSLKEKVLRFEDQTESHVQVVMVDYLQKARLQGFHPKMQRDEELEHIVNQFAEFGEEHGHITILISQVPSHAAGGQTEFLGIRQAIARSYAATWGAHYIITANRTQEETTRLRSSEDKHPRLNLFLCKNKDNPIGTCYTLGIPEEARWKFFRQKSELERAAKLLNPKAYQRT